MNTITTKTTSSRNFQQHWLSDIAALNAAKVDPIAPDEYVIRFYDSRRRSFDLSGTRGENFGEIFRTAVLERVKRSSGPLYGNMVRNQTPN